MNRLHIIGRIEKALYLIASLREMVDLDTPLPPRRQSRRDQVLTTSLLVIRQELDNALDALTHQQPSGVMAVERAGEHHHAVV
jgi:hypothetical protein